MNRIIYTIIVLIFISCVPIKQTVYTSETDIFNKTVPAVVVVYAFDNNIELQGQGTGFVIDKSGIIATNYHVISNSYALTVLFTNGEKYDVKEIINVDKMRDIAIIKIQGYDLPAVTLGNSNNILVGENVITIGNPLGLSNTLSSGIISGIRTDLDYKLIQTTAPISPGSSGGPLLNMKGEVIGITTLYLKEGQNLNFAVPINYLIALKSSGFNQTKNILESSKEELELKKQLADVYYNEEDYYEASKLLYEIISEDSLDPVIYFKLGYSLHKIAVTLAPHGSDDPLWEEFAIAAIDNFNRTVELDPDSEFGYLKIARVYGLWMIDAIKKKKPSQFRTALINAQNSGGFFTFVLETNRSMLMSCSLNSILFTNGDDDTFPMWYLQEIENVRKDVTIINLSLLNVPFYIKYLRDFKGISFGLNDEEIDELSAKYWPTPRNEKIKLEIIPNENYFQVKHLPLIINHSYLTQEWEYLSIADQLVLNIVKNYLNEKDLYFAITLSWVDYSVPFALLDHLVFEGLVYKLVAQPAKRFLSYQKWEKNLLENYRYTVFSDPRIFGENISYGFIQNYRTSFNELAKMYYYRGDRYKVREILEFKDTVIPKENIPIPWEKLTDMHEDGRIIKLYDFADLTFNEMEILDGLYTNIIETQWEPTALDTPYYYYKIADYYLDKSDYDLSEKYIREYLKFEPNDEKAKAILMYTNFENKKYSKAIEIANELLKNDPENTTINGFLGQHYTEVDKYDEAKLFFKKVLNVDRKDYDTYNSYGLVYLYEGDFESALDNFNKVLEYAPNYADNYKYALENIAETYKAVGKLEKAKELFTKLIEIDPTLCLAYSKLAIIYDITGNNELSSVLLQIAIDNIWKEYYGQIGLACYYSHKGDIKNAISYLETAINMGFNDFSWLKFDPDLENVRKNRKFWYLIDGK